ncbi:Clp protease N-terminal domain-containing protein [Streptomyces europaeiscabiei]|uniref:Clp protease N-terminal domain-containing protein n=1 Tax=Streptomyces europaeiscabiei TaxID=146819 RepID=UPI0029A462FC|nr:Clp protease N-terminal domain-containing protein [Streptomyces europaeiscabiei]MDX3691321.1 Clp protease N-terminal domain-containing protein [Streptomyces europaeiscabiei]
MFERFTQDARAVVKGAVEHCERSRSRTVDAEHMLLALIDRGAGRGSFALAALGLAERGESVARALEEARRRAGLSQAEAEALAGLGIDVSEIVARVEEVHGVGAMSGDRKDKGRWGGHRSFSRGAKEVLERSLRIAIARRDRRIGDEHILLALTARPGVAAEVLADHGVTHESVTRVLHGGGGAKAG